MSHIDEQPTLLRPPERDATKAPIENVLEVTELKVLGPVCTNSAVFRDGGEDGCKAASRCLDLSISPSLHLPEPALT